MDLVIDDGDHSWAGNTKTIEALWPLVKPGGWYVIEDVSTGGDVRGMMRGKYSQALRDPSGYASVAHNATGALREVYKRNDVFFSDTLIGVVDFKRSPFIKSPKSPSVSCTTRSIRMAIWS